MHFFLYRCLLCISIILSFLSIHPCAKAAQFTAQLSITPPLDILVYQLTVKDRIYRIEKKEGPADIPSMPTIYNQEDQISIGLIPLEKKLTETFEEVHVNKAETITLEAVFP